MREVQGATPLRRLGGYSCMNYRVSVYQCDWNGYFLALGDF